MLCGENDRWADSSFMHATFTDLKRLNNKTELKVYLGVGRAFNLLSTKDETHSSATRDAFSRTLNFLEVHQNKSMEK